MVRVVEGVKNLPPDLDLVTYLLACEQGPDARPEFPVEELH